VTLGADVGATLTKLATHGPRGILQFRLVPSHAIEQVAREVESFRAERLSLTGGGAPGLAIILGLDTAVMGEFEAWRRGAEALLRRQNQAADEPYLLVSLGTGTSALLVKGEQVTRMGGTALGGGTILGLGAALTGQARFDELVDLATRGDRRNVDLLVSDIYGPGGSPLPGDLNASSFAKLAHWPEAERPEPCDLADAVMGLVGENVGLICNGLAAAARVERIVFGGTTLRNNPVLMGILAGLGAALGNEVVFLSDGEFTGAVGALELAAA
jgi:type II pantothenate kinase